MATTTNLSSLVINYLTQAQYDNAKEAGTLNNHQLYFTPDIKITVSSTMPTTNDGINGDIWLLYNVDA